MPIIATIAQAILHAQITGCRNNESWSWYYVTTLYTITTLVISTMNAHSYLCGGFQRLALVHIHRIQNMYIHDVNRHEDHASHHATTELMLWSPWFITHNHSVYKQGLSQLTLQPGLTRLQVTIRRSVAKALWADSVAFGGTTGAAQAAPGWVTSQSV